MTRHSHYAGRHWEPIVLFGVAALVVSPPLWPAQCVGPAQLEARVRAHPNADGYAALGAGSETTINPRVRPRCFKLDSSLSRAHLA
jgi:hypothetical protein